MKVIFKNYRNKLEIDKLRRLKGVIIHDRIEDYFDVDNFYQVPGTMRRIIIGRKTDFESIEDFVVHFYAMYHVKDNEFKMTNDFFERVYTLEENDFESTKKMIDAVYNQISAQFVELRTREEDRKCILDLVNVDIRLNEFIQGYYISDVADYFSDHKNCYVIYTHEIGSA